MLDLSGKIAVITGGTSGIGFAIAKTLSTHNCRTVIVGRDIKKGKASENKINDLCMGKPGKEKMCTFYQCDVGNPEDAKETCMKILKNFGRADILVLNAAMEFEEPINLVKLENWQRVFDVNVNGVFYFVRFLIDSMLKNKKGNIIIIGSVVSHTGAGGGIHYAASKTALIGIVNRINYELLSKGIRANMISPGVIDTPMLRKKYPDTPEINRKIIESIPSGRIGLPDDIADLALFLASDMSGYICGQDILVDGGRLFYRRPVKK
jgi:3-oxoacyl-[acyl-carrier protein] reductase